MRKLLVFFLFLFGLIAATPYAAGFMLKKNFLEVIAAFSQNKNFKIEVVDYKQGWLNSETQIRISIPFKSSPASKEKPMDKTAELVEIITSHITHGPLIQDPFTKQFSLALASIQSEINFPILLTSDNTPFAEITTVVDFNNHWHSQTKQAPKTIALAEFGKFSFEGSQGTFDFDCQGGFLSQLNISTESKGILFTPASQSIIQEVRVDSLSYQVASTREASSEWIGDSKMTSPKVSIKKADNSVIAIEGLELTHSARNPEPTLYGFNLNLSLKNVQTANDLLPSFGPLKLLFAINNLNTEGLLKLTDFLRQPHSPPISKEDRDAYLKLIMGALSSSSSITQDLLISTPSGDLKSDASLALKGDPKTITPESLPTSVSAVLHVQAATALIDKLLAAQTSPTPTEIPSPSSLPPAADATTTQATLTKPMAAANTSTAVDTLTTPVSPTPTENTPPTAKQKFDKLLEQGYIMREGDNYVISIQFENGITLINGKTMGP
jgi:uncharacterized protein YdgA (DUF945 family)